MTKKVKLITYKSQYYLISQDRTAKKGDAIFFYHMNSRKKGQLWKHSESGDIRVSEGGVVHRVYNYETIVATPNQIGIVYVNNKMSTKGLHNYYIAEATKEQLREMKLRNRGECEVELEPNGDLKLIDGKVVIIPSENATRVTKQTS